MGTREVIRQLRMGTPLPRSQSWRGCAIRRTPILIALAFSLVISASAKEPIVGNWQMISQKIGASETKPFPIMIKIRQESATKLTFTYVAGRDQEVKMTFSAYLNGTAAPITNGTGVVIGTATLKKSGANYSLMLQSRGKRPEPGTMTLSEHSKLLTSQSTVDLPDRGVTQIVQIFSREPM